jgi:hypothetical protein
MHVCFGSVAASQHCISERLLLSAYRPLGGGALSGCFRLLQILAENSRVYWLATA